MRDTYWKILGELWFWTGNTSPWCKILHSEKASLYAQDFRTRDGKLYNILYKTFETHFFYSLILSSELRPTGPQDFGTPRPSQSAKVKVIHKEKLGTFQRSNVQGESSRLVSCWSEVARPPSLNNKPTTGDLAYSRRSIIFIFGPVRLGLSCQCGKCKIYCNLNG